MISILDTDWTTLIQAHRPTTALTESVCDGGTFTLEPPEMGGGNGNGPNGNPAIPGDGSKSSLPQRPMSASVCSNRLVNRLVQNYTTRWQFMKCKQIFCFYSTTIVPPTRCISRLDI